VLLFRFGVQVQSFDQTVICLVDSFFFFPVYFEKAQVMVLCYEGPLESTFLKKNRSFNSVALGNMLKFLMNVLYCMPSPCI